MPFLGGRWLGVFEGVKCQKPPKKWGSVTLLSHIFEICLYYSNFFLSFTIIIDHPDTLDAGDSGEICVWDTSEIPLKLRDFITLIIFMGLKNFSLGLHKAQLLLGIPQGSNFFLE
jgi:hypothetical protein